jgi:hypothetical protein
MQSVIHMTLRSRLLILAWLLTWIATGPLFGTHLSDFPDTTDGPASLQTARQQHFFHVSNQVSNFQEFDVALLDEDDAKKRKLEQSSVLGVHCPLPNRPLLPKSVMESRAMHPRLLLFSASQSSRAPPSVVSL